MEIVAAIIAVLHRSSRLITHEGVRQGSLKHSELVQSYNEVTGVIRDVIGGYETPTAKTAYELLRARWADPYMWQEDAVANALEEITEEDRFGIGNIILASRLPGKTRIRKEMPPRPRPDEPKRSDGVVQRPSQPATSGRTRAYANADATDEDEGDLLA